MADPRLIETDSFPFEFLSRLAERESWRKEVHRPIYHVHKWWAKRLGSVFRGMILGCALEPDADLAVEFYRTQELSGLRVFDPFMGSGTTIGEAHKLGLTAVGRDINPVATNSVRVALGPLDRNRLRQAYAELDETVGIRIRELYRSLDSKGRPCDVLYHFWVMRADCPSCSQPLDLFPSRIIARHANPRQRPEVQILCPQCHGIFPSRNGSQEERCPACLTTFDPQSGASRGKFADCPHCRHEFAVSPAVAANGDRPTFRLYGKLVLTADGEKEYVPATSRDLERYERCTELLRDELRTGSIELPSLRLEPGYNTRQAMGYGFRAWRDFFNDRQLLALGWLRSAILTVEPQSVRDALLTLFSGVLEFNNLFASYKGEGTGAVRHMFSHHILKPEKTPIEAHVWGTPKSSGSFSNLFRSRLLRALDYREQPTEIQGATGAPVGCAHSFTGEVLSQWPSNGSPAERAICLSCGDSSRTELPSGSMDLVVTDPPFFDNVHYSELADFFYAWQQLNPGCAAGSTRAKGEVQDTQAEYFATKLCAVFAECHRVLRDNGLLVFTYHHSREEGWESLAKAVFNAGFRFVNCHPVRAEMSVGTPKSQAKEPIQLDIIVICRKAGDAAQPAVRSLAMATARQKLARLSDAGFALSRNDCKIVLIGQLLTAAKGCDEIEELLAIACAELNALNIADLQGAAGRQRRGPQMILFEST